MIVTGGLVWFPTICVDPALVHELGRDRRRAHDPLDRDARTTARSRRSTRRSGRRSEHNLDLARRSSRSSRRRSGCCSPTSSTRRSRGLTDLPEHPLPAGRARARDHRPDLRELIYSPTQGLLNNLFEDPQHGQLIDWLGNPSINLWAVLVFAVLAARELRDDHLPGRAEGRSTRRCARRRRSTARASARAFFTVVLPALKPINIVLVVITVIEALRAFDIVYIINSGRNGLELLSVLDHRQHHRRGEPDRLRLGDRGRAAHDLARPDRRSSSGTRFQEAEA